MRLLLRGGTVIDGLGGDPMAGDVLTHDDRIAAVGAIPVSDAELVLDVGGLAVAPGFIDCHSHSELDLLVDPFAAPKVAQGVTSEIVANCGLGPFPVRSPIADEAMRILVPRRAASAAPSSFPALADYRRTLRAQGAAVNLFAHVPHGAVRLSVVGSEDRAATAAEVAEMRGLVDEAFREGAVGLSFGLLYAPGCFTPIEELASLGEVAAAHRRPLVFHVRNECDRFEESIEEALEVGRRAGAAIHISHLKVADPDNWGRAGVALSRLEEERTHGRRVTCDQYPYTAGSSSFTTLLPPWALAGGTAALLARLRDPQARRRMQAAMDGKETIPDWPNLSRRIGWERAVVGSAPGAEAMEGRSVAQLAQARGLAPAEVVFRLLLDSDAAAIGIWHQMSEDDVRTVMQYPAQMVGSDGLPTDGKPHPRLWGTFPRVLGRYARDLGLLSLPQAVRKMTGLPAETFRLEGRGVLRPGAFADICVFDPARVIDRATWEEPSLPPEGIIHVLCNGAFTMRDGRRTEERPGRA